MGEFQAKGLEHGYTHPTSAQILFPVDDLLCNIDKINTLAAFLNRVPRIKEPSVGLTKIIKNYERSPGDVSYGFLDIHEGQFTYSASKKPTFGFVDTEAIVSSLDIDKNPQILTQQERFAFQSIFDKGLTLGLVPQETSLLTEYKGLPSEAASEFFNIYYTVKSIESLADDLTNEGNLTPLRSMIKQLNHKIK